MFRFADCISMGVKICIITSGWCRIILMRHNYNVGAVFFSKARIHNLGCIRCSLYFIRQNCLFTGLMCFQCNWSWVFRWRKVHNLRTAADLRKPPTFRSIYTTSCNWLYCCTLADEVSVFSNRSICPSGRCVVGQHGSKATKPFKINVA